MPSQAYWAPPGGPHCRIACARTHDLLRLRRCWERVGVRLCPAPQGQRAIPRRCSTRAWRISALGCAGPAVRAAEVREAQVHTQCPAAPKVHASPPGARALRQRQAA